MERFPVLSGGPILAVDDFGASLEFYTRVVGFHVDARFEGPDFAILSNGPVSVCLAQQGHPADDLPDYVMTAPATPSKPAAMIVLRVADLEAAHRELESRGATFVSEPWSPPWGGGRFFLRDPSGHLLEIEMLPPSSAG